MNDQHIYNLLRKGENLHCEFKEATKDLPKNLFETICAFLNSDGGTILLGVRDDGTVIGVEEEKISQMKIDLANLSNNSQKIDPTYLLFPEVFEVMGKKIISVQIPVSSHLHKSQGEIYLRSEDGDYRVRGTHQLSGIINRKLGMFSEQRPMIAFSMADLRQDLFERAKRLILTHNPRHPWADLEPERLLRVAGFYTESPESNEPCLSLGAILTFGHDLAIRKAAPAYVFDCLLRRDNIDRYDDRVQIQTNLIDAFDQMMDFIEKHLNDPFYLEGTQRVSLRAKIFREAISNIISHREYLHGSPGRVMIYRDKVIFDNPCTPHYAGNITLENLEPFARNPVICQFMNQIGRFDRLGSGVRNINKYLPIYVKGAKPIFNEMDRGSFKLTIPLLEDLAPPVTAPVTAPVNGYVLKLLKIIGLTGSIGNSEILDALDLKNRRRMRETYIQPAMEGHLIEYTIPDKPNSRLQKYCLTDKGKKLLEASNHE